MNDSYEKKASQQKSLSKADSSGANKRMSITLPPELAAHLEEEAAALGVSLAEVARRAIARDAYLQEEVSNGASLFLKTKEGLYELTL